ncbi:MAG: HIT family protein [Planctomycetes bacterium]|nr:HIT family protein [Planctomycetota bacterium]
MDCVFCKIIKGEIPSSKLYEDENALAILDINPVAAGHTLVISKGHYPEFLDAPPEAMAEFMKTAHKVIGAVAKGTGAEGYNLLINNNRCAGQVIPHLHIHVIPRKKGDGLRFEWIPRPYPEGGMEKIAKAIKAYFS